jgi:hypothetical protein
MGIAPSAPDRHLRAWGFSIAARPPGRPAAWRDRLTGRVLAEADAVELARKRERASKARAK